MLVTLLFNIFIKEIFYFIFKAKLVNYADTVYILEEGLFRYVGI